MLYNSLTFLIFSITLRNIAIYAIRILYNLYDIRKSSSVIYERTIICYAILILYSFGQQRVAHGPFSSSRRIQFLYVLLSFIGSDNTNYHTSTIFKKIPIGRKQLFQYNQKKYIYYTIIIMCFVTPFCLDTYLPRAPSPTPLPRSTARQMPSRARPWTRARRRIRIRRGGSPAQSRPPLRHSNWSQRTSRGREGPLIVIARRPVFS